VSGPGETSISTFANLVLWQATQDGANQIEFIMDEASAPGRHFTIRLRVDGVPYDLAPPPGHVFEQVVAYFLNQANVTPGENGSLNGTLRIDRQQIISYAKEGGDVKELSASTWIVWSDGLDQRLVLTRDATNIAGG
jgi:hypothetical protein